jgi:plasmid stabilization system protein ParE
MAKQPGAGQNQKAPQEVIEKIKWRARALTDIERLHVFLKDKNPDAAARAVAAILNGANLLKSSPRIGRPMPDGTRRREWFVTFGTGAYVLRYMFEDDEIPIIIRVWHSRENRDS